MYVCIIIYIVVTTYLNHFKSAVYLNTNYIISNQIISVHIISNHVESCHIISNTLLET